MAGAAVELADAIQINPNDTDQIADAIFTALQMPYEEQAKRISKMQAILSVQTVNMAVPVSPVRLSHTWVRVAV